MRKFIEIMENVKSDTLLHHVSDMVKRGDHEGFDPYWKLKADPRVLENEASMFHISELIAAGFTSGIHPDWDLKIIDDDQSMGWHPEIDEEETPRMKPVRYGPYDTMKAAKREENRLNDDMSIHTELETWVADLDPNDGKYYVHKFEHNGKSWEQVHEIDEEEKPKHKVCAVHQREGVGNGWFECPDEHAELFVVEDDEGNPVESYNDRNSAEAHTHHLNTGEQILDEVDDVPYDDPEMVKGRGIQDYLDADHIAKSKITIYADEPDYAVELAAIHERGHMQNEAFKELANRDIQLTDDQMIMAGRY